MKCLHCGYSDSIPRKEGTNVVLCPQCGAKLELDIAQPIQTDSESSFSQQSEEQNLKVAKAVHVGFGDFAGNLAANVTVSTGTQKVNSSSQSKLSIDPHEIGVDDTTTGTSHFTTDDMLLGLELNEGASDTPEESDTEIDDVYSKIESGFKKRQEELDELETQLKRREESLIEQEKHLAEEIKLNREAAEDYLQAKKMYESQGQETGSRTFITESSEKQSAPGYLHALLRIFAGIAILLLILLFYQVFALNKAKQKIAILEGHTFSPKTMAEETNPLLLKMRNDYQQLQNIMNRNAETVEEVDYQILAMETFLKNYKQENAFSGMSEILTVESRLSDCKNLRQSFGLQTNNQSIPLMDQQQK